MKNNQRIIQNYNKAIVKFNINKMISLQLAALQVSIEEWLEMKLFLKSKNTYFKRDFRFVGNGSLLLFLII